MEVESSQEKVYIKLLEKALEELEYYHDDMVADKERDKSVSEDLNTLCCNIRWEISGRLELVKETV